MISWLEVHLVQAIASVIVIKTIIGHGLMELVLWPSLFQAKILQLHGTEKIFCRRIYATLVTIGVFSPRILNVCAS